ncbi:MAG: hypothetical protein F6K34_14550, partial [Okeania sp. SIO4D6]|nr:hypothetical protein [Okeania sp. SIO4D6]
VFISNIIIYFYDYQKPEVSPSLIPAFRHPEQTLQFFLAFLGSPLGSGFEISPLTSSIFIGGVEIGIFCCLFIYLLKHIKNYHILERTIGWMMIAIYSIISALITAVGRVGFGVESALPSRYTTFSIYLIIAIIHLLPIVLSHIYSQINPIKSQVWLYKVTVAIAMTGLMILHYKSFTYSVKEIKSSYQLRMEGKTCLSFINIIENKFCIEENILGNYDHVKDLVKGLNYLGMLKPNLVASNNIEAIAAEKSPDQTYGSLDGIIPLNSWYFVNGWAFLPERNEPADAIILTYKNQAVEEGRSGATRRRRQTQGNAHQERNKEKVVLPGVGDRPKGMRTKRGTRKKWMGTQTPTNYKHPVDGGVLNPKEKDDWIIFDVLMSAQTQRENLVQLFNNPAYLNAGWEQTISGKLLPEGKLKIAAWAFDAKLGKAYKLDTNHPITKNGSGVGE